MGKWSLFVFAAVTSTAIVAAEPARASEGHSKLHLAGGDEVDEKRPYWFEISLAPEIVRHRPFRSGSRSGDTTEVAWTLGAELKTWGADLEIEGGPSVTVDSDDDEEDESRFSASARLLAPEQLLGPVRPFISYGVEFGFAEFFDRSSGTEHSFEAGLSYRGASGIFEYAIEAAPGLVRSSELGADHVGVRLKPELDVTLVEDLLNFHVDAEGKRLWYSGIQEGADRERRDWSLEAFAGLNFSGALNRVLKLPPGQQVFHDAIVGLSWTEVDSNLGTEDESDLKIKPAVSIKVHF